MAKSATEFKERRKQITFARPLVWCAGLLLLAMYLISPFQFAKPEVQWPGFAAAIMAVGLGGVGIWGLYRVRKNKLKHLASWAFYVLITLMGAFALGISFLIYR